MNNHCYNPNNPQRLPKGFFKENDAEIFVKDFGGFVKKGITERWFWMGFQALEKSGLTYYETDEEESKIRNRLVLINLIFFEYCHIVYVNESVFFENVNKDSLHEIYSDYANKDMTELEKIHNSLIKYFGSCNNLADELWILSQEGSCNCLIPRSSSLLFLDKENACKKDGDGWIQDGFNHISNFKSMELFN